MGKEPKSLVLDDIQAYNEWMEIPQTWRILGKKNVETKKGIPAMVVLFEVKGQEIGVFDFALRREPGKSFEILKRIYNQMQQPPKPSAMG